MSDDETINEVVEKLFERANPLFLENPAATAVALMGLAESACVNIYGIKNTAMYFYAIADNLATLEME